MCVARNEVMSSDGTRSDFILDALLQEGLRIFFLVPGWLDRSVICRRWRGIPGCADRAALTKGRRLHG